MSSNETLLRIQNCSAGKFFCISKFKCLGVASSLEILQVGHGMHVAWTGNFSPANPTHLRIPKKNRNKKFSSEQVRMCGFRIRPCNTSRLTTHARGIDRLSELFKSKPPLNIQPESKQKIFLSIMASSNARVSYQASRYNTADIACSQH